jgi:hypothetical protein
MFLFAGGFLFVVGLDPVFPVLAGGAIFAAEFEARDLGVAHFALFGRGFGVKYCTYDSASVAPVWRLKM